MDVGTKFVTFENLNNLIEEHKKEKVNYKKYEFDNISYTLLLIDINKITKENIKLKTQLQQLQQSKKVSD